MKTNIGWLVITGLSLLLALAILAFIIGALAEPDLNLFTMMSSALWTTFAPHFVLLALFCLLLSSFGYWRYRSKVAVLSIAISIAAFCGAVFITSAIISASVVAGGAVNPLRGLWLRPMSDDGPDHMISYKDVGSQTLTMAIYQPPQITASTPVMLYIHGGGFKVGSNVETDADLRWFANRGWLVFSPGYQLWTGQTATWNLASDDIACAAIWLNANIQRYGGQLERFAVLGDSAGGNLAINYAYAAATGQLQSTCAGDAPVATAVVVQYPAVDPLAIYEHGFAVPGFEPKKLITGFLGGDPYAFPERVAAVSAYRYLSSAAPPTLIIAPQKDALVPPWSVYRFADYARLAGVDIELVKIPFASHVYNQLAFQSIGNQARLTITERYLLEKGHLKQ